MDQFLKRLDELDEKEKARARVLIEKFEKAKESDSPTKQREMYEINKELELLLPTSERMSEKAKRIRRVALLVKELMGDRSIRQTSVDSGVTASYLSGILKGKYLPSADTLMKLAAPEANPKNGILLEDLMLAAGYQTDYVAEAVKDAFYEEITDEKSGKTIDITPNMEMLSRLTAYSEGYEARKSPQERQRERMQMISKYESLATGIVYRALAEKGLQFSSPKEQVVGVRGFRPDMVVYVAQQPILEWWFEFKYLGETPGINGNRGYVNVRHLLGQVMFIEPNLQRKVSIVINKESDFETMLGYKDKLAYRGDLSIILVDTETFTVLREEYLSHYEMYSKDSEFYII